MKCRLPETLRSKIDLFQATGRIFREQDELFLEPGWVQVMIGQGMRPRSYHPIADQLSNEDLGKFFSDLRTLIDRAVKTLPSHEAFVRDHCASAV